MRTLILGVVSGFLGIGCIGTDFVDDPVGSSQSGMASISLEPKLAALMAGERLNFSANYLDEDGTLVPDTIFTWKSSDTSVVMIDQDGVATATAAGQVEVVAEANGVSSEPSLVSVVANTQEVALVSISSMTTTIMIDEMTSFIATAKNSLDEVVSGQTFTWTSSDPAIVSVAGAGGDTGLVRGLEQGTARITVETNGKRSPSVMVQVTAAGGGRTGSFQGRSSYTVVGTATLRPATMGNLVLEFSEAFSTSTGPDLQIFLSDQNVVTARSISLGRLQSASGTQTYMVPDGVSIDEFDWVLVHCVPFNVTFGLAELD